MASFSLILSACIVILQISRGGECMTYYIKPMETDRCPLNTTAQTCLTLSTFAANHSNTPSATILMLSGIHTLDRNISMSNLLDLRISAYLNATNVTIGCELSSRFVLDSIEEAHISNIHLIGCGNSTVKNIDFLTIKDTIFEGRTDSGTSLTLINTTAEIFQSVFVNNQLGTFVQSASSLQLLTTNVFWFVYQNTGNVTLGGALIFSHSNISISHCSFLNNRADVGGDIFTEESSTVSIYNSTFSGDDSVCEMTGFKESPFGGSIFSHKGNVSIMESQFNNKHAIIGGSIASSISTFSIWRSSFFSNCATDHGGALFAYNSSVVINESYFHQNEAGAAAGVSTHQGAIYIEASVFTNNTAWRHAAALDFYSDYSEVRGCIFENNVAGSFAGAVLFWLSTSIMNGTLSLDRELEIENDECNRTDSRYITIFNDSQAVSCGRNSFIANEAPIGAALYVINGTVKSVGSTLFLKNRATLYASIYFLDSNGEFEGLTETFQNLGSFFAFNSNITFSGYSTFANCSPSKTTTANFEEGGALTLFHTTLTFHGVSRLEHNHAVIGGGIIATESKIYLNDYVHVFNNYAFRSGGGIHLSQSELHSIQESNVTILDNNANEKGGGIHAVSSSVVCTVTGLKVTDGYGNTTETYKGTLLNIVGNSAERGGGLFLEANSKVTLLKNYIFDTHNYPTALNLIRNSAHYGGAIYVDDESYSGTCASNPFEVSSQQSECFIRVIATHTINTENTNYSLINVKFDFNLATGSGSTLFGGLLDRCSVSLFNEVDRTIEGPRTRVAYPKMKCGELPEKPKK